MRSLGTVAPWASPTFTVTLAATDDCHCDTCGCFPEDAHSIRLGSAADGDSVTDGGDEAATADTTPDEGETESNDSTVGARTDDDGCACRAQPCGSRAWALALLAAFARPRRRRR